MLPRVPVRQWVLSLPQRLRYLLAWDHRLCRAVLGVFVRALLDFYHRQARRAGIGDGHTSTLTVIQRFGGGLNFNVHFHTLALAGISSASVQGRIAEKLTALIPRSRVNLMLYHGVLAPHARWRSRVVLAEPADSAAPGVASALGPAGGMRPALREGRRHWAWVHSMQRAFGIDVLACPRCTGRLRLVATVEDPQAIRALLLSLGLPAAVPQPTPPRPP